jgi:thiamine pyrophosphate-dependent acetolactate synthase large subunit-like protein
MAMPIESCFAALAARWRDEIVVTSAGNSSEVWWETTRDLDKTFYLEASMSLSTMFTAGLALSYPELKFWAFVGDGAFVMNTGFLFVEQQLALANMASIIVSNRCYGSTDAVRLPNGPGIDFAAMARAAGIPNVYRFASLSELESNFEPAFRGVGPTTIVLEIDPPERHYESPPFDGPELKYRFGRSLEQRLGRRILP